MLEVKLKKQIYQVAVVGIDKIKNIDMDTIKEGVEKVKNV